MANEEIGQESGDAWERRGNMRLSEAEILLLWNLDGDNAHFRVDYEILRASTDLILVAEADEFQPSHVFGIHLDTVENGMMAMEDVAGTPPAKIFEGTIMITNRENRNAGDGACGVLYPNGFAALVDSGPESERTKRRMLAAKLANNLLTPEEMANLRIASPEDGI